MPTIVRYLRLVGFLEGVSWLALLTAMYLKYHHAMPAAVRIPGMVHGLLFLLFGVLLVMAIRWLRWSVGRGVLAFAASVLPCGTFFLDHQLRKWGAEAVVTVLETGASES